MIRGPFKLLQVINAPRHADRLARLHLGDGDLGFILVFAWWQEATSTLAGWWGLAQLVMSVGIIIAVTAPIIGNDDIHAFGQACMILSAASQ